MQNGSRDLLRAMRTKARKHYVTTTYDENGNMLGSYVTPYPPGEVRAEVRVVEC